MIAEIKEYLGVLEDIKHEIRANLQELDEESLNWTPLSSDLTNSICGPF